MTVTTASELRKRQDEILLPNEEGWKEEIITVSPDEVRGLQEPEEFLFLYRDVQKVMADMISDPQLFGRLVLRGREKWVKINTPVGGQDIIKEVRIYDEPHHCDAFLTAQEAVLKLSPQPLHSVVAAMQLYSDKTVITFRGHSLHPVRFTLLNIPGSFRGDYLQHVAYFPEFPTGTKNEVKLVALSKCLELLFAPVKPAVAEGVELQAPSGSKYLFFPRLLSYVADDPEWRDLLAIYNHSSSVPCDKCTVSPSDLGLNVQTEPTVSYRCGLQTKHIQEKAVSALKDPTRTAQSVLDYCTDRGVKSVLSGLFSLTPPSPADGSYTAGAFSRDGDIHLAAGYDTLHNDDLGWVKDFISAVCEYIKDARNSHTRIFKKMNDFLAKCERTDDFPLPSNGYFPKMPHAQALEHRNVLQLLPLIFNAIISDLPSTQEATVILDLICRVVDTYMDCHRRNKPPFYSGEDLVALQEKITVTNDLTVKLLGRYLPSISGAPGATIKRHRHVNHFVPTVRWLGHPKHYSSQKFEASHVHVKRAWK